MTDFDHYLRSRDLPLEWGIDDLPESFYRDYAEFIAGRVENPDLERRQAAKWLSLYAQCPSLARGRQHVIRLIRARVAALDRLHPRKAGAAARPSP